MLWTGAPYIGIRTFYGAGIWTYDRLLALCWSNLTGTGITVASYKGHSDIGGWQGGVWVFYHGVCWNWIGVILLLSVISNQVAFLMIVELSELPTINLTLLSVMPVVIYDRGCPEPDAHMNRRVHGMLCKCPCAQSFSFLEPNES